MSKWIIEPVDLPVDLILGEAPVPLCRLHVEALRERFHMQPAWVPEALVDRLLISAKQTLRPAAVLIPLVMREEGLTILFTRRTVHLTEHAGEISFPGGRLDVRDYSLIDTALRETEEEIGLARCHIEVLGSMPEWLTATGYRITPVVALVRPPFLLQAQASEVVEIFEIPLTFFMNGLHYQRRSGELAGGAGRRDFHAIQYQHFFIWGATAGMLRNLFHFLRA